MFDSLASDFIKRLDETIKKRDTFEEYGRSGTVRTTRRNQIS